MTTTLTKEFAVETSAHSLGRNRPQVLGRRLWLPMLALSVMAFTVGFVLALVRAAEISENGATDTAAALQHVTAGFMFLGFASVFAAISFAIARILGEFRAGGGEVQETVGDEVQTLKMPVTSKVFMAGMMMAMMLILIPVALHFVFATDVTSSVASLEASEERFIVLEGVRRLGVAVYLASIAFGLATIVTVLRFQTTRIRELAE